MTPETICANCGKNPAHYCYLCWECLGGNPAIQSNTAFASKLTYEQQEKQAKAIPGAALGGLTPHAPDQCNIHFAPVLNRFCAQCFDIIHAKCVPGERPSLITLERIFALHDHKYGSPEEWRKAIQWDILKWANGNWKEPKVWCEHLHHDGDAWILTWPAPKMLPGATGGCRIKRELDDDWHYCPICAAPRPGGG